MVTGGSRTGGIGHNSNPKSMLEKFNTGLLDADMRFDAANNYPSAGPFLQSFPKARCSKGGKSHFAKKPTGFRVQPGIRPA